MAGPIYSIAPHAPFLDTLAEAVLDGALVPDWPRQGPFWLSDITILLPTRRARNVLADALVRKMGARPMLLPDIRALGGEDGAAEPFLPPFDAPALPAPVNTIKRRLMLARLTERWLAAQTSNPFSAPGLGGYTGAPNTAEIFALADSLGTLIDDFAIARIPLSALDAIAPQELAEQWQKSLSFVRFVLDLWPQVLIEDGEIEAADRTNQLLERQAGALGALYGDRPVIVAGSTGSIPATADLIVAISRLVRGAVVLPGVDRSLSPSQTQALVAETGNPHGHPQYGLARLLARLNTQPAAVTELAPEPDHPRTAIISHALALAADTAHWASAADAIGPALLHTASTGLSVIVARTQDEEARAIAVLVRERLHNKKTVAIIAPDQVLARRIAAELDRFAIQVDDAAGTPLVRARAGRLVRQIVSVLAGNFAAVDLMALLRNRHVSLGMGRAEVAGAANRLDLGVLRGQRPAPGLAGLRAAADKNLSHPPHNRRQHLSPDDVARIDRLLDALEGALAPLRALYDEGGFTAGEFALAMHQTLARVRAAEPGETAIAIEGEVELDRWAETLGTHRAHGPRLDQAAAALALDLLMSGYVVRPTRPARDDVMLFGRLEARLMSAETVVLAGLTEGVWPEIADPGPWMSRGMRMAVGLEPPEKLHGLAAHDFLMASGGAEVVLSYAERAGTSPATPSRLIQRLSAFVGKAVTDEMIARGDHWLIDARRLDLVAGPVQPARRPVPRPPAQVRPRGLSITEAETLLRSPYDLYAKYVLGLRALPALGADPDAAERGAIIHKIFGDFLLRGNDVMAPEAQARLDALAQEVFAGLEAIPERRDIWIKRFAHAARQFLDYERARDGAIVSRHAEIDGRYRFEIAGVAFELRGRADRIDMRGDDHYEIIDFKTGSIPEANVMKAFLAPQLALEAVIARHAGFAGLAGQETAALTYIKVANGPKAFDAKPYAIPDGMELPQAVDALFRRFQSHVEAVLLSDTHPMGARVLPNPKQRYEGDYDHLARTDEWTLAEAEEAA